MAYKILSENINKYNQANFEDYKDRLVYRLFKKYSKVSEYYNILKVRKHIDSSFVFFKNNNIYQLKNIEFWVETEFIVGFGWYQKNRNDNILNKIKFSRTKFGELTFTDEYFEIFENIYCEIVKDNYLNFNKLFENLNNDNISAYYQKEFPNFFNYSDVDIAEFNCRNMQYDRKEVQKIFFSFLRNDKWLVN